MSVFLAAAASFAVSLAVVLAIERKAAVFGLIDRPNDRSSHVVPRPRGGGIGILCGVAAGLAVAIAADLRLEAPLWAVLGASLIVATAGLWDDLSPLGAAPRLAAQVVAAGLVVWTCGGLARLPLPPPLDVPLGAVGPIVAIVWLVGVTNFFNFMDGADGLAAGQAAITLAAFAHVVADSSVTVVAVLPLAATLAFLVRNWAPAKIFLGDVGSGWLGFLMAALPFARSVESRGQLVLFVATSLVLFLVDPAVTLARRLWRGAPLATSHREHAYQRLFKPDEPHAPVVASILAGAAVASIAAIAGYAYPALAWPAVIIALAVAGIEWWVAAVRSRSPSGAARRIAR